MKKMMIVLPFVMTMLLMVSGVLFQAGCESAEGLDGLQVEPSSVTLTPGTSNSVIFTALLNVTNKLAFPIEWSVSDTSLGSIAVSTANSAVYRSTGRNGNNVIKARDQYSNEGVATITQTSDSYLLTLTASPTSLTSTETACTVTVSGGVGPYSWSVGNSALGNVSGSGSSVMYASTQAGSNVIIVHDDNGVAASIAITRAAGTGSGGTTPTPGG